MGISMTYKPEVGDKVFLRSNEPDQALVVGKVVRLHLMGRMSCSPIPVVQDEKTGKEYLGGCIRPYDMNTHADLELLRPIEQWNYLVQDTDAMNQISEKYGVKYKTFK